MGYYINEVNGKSLPTKGKAAFLLENVKDSKYTTGFSFQENLVCVVDNGMFDAAGYCYSKDEFKVFSENDGRRKNWLIVPDADKLSGY